MNCEAITLRYGQGHKYTKDCLVRLVQGRPYAEAAAIIGWTDPPPIIIRAGIGTLVIGTDHQDFTPAPTVGQMAKSWIASLTDRTPATPEQLTTRQGLCDTCEWMEPKRKVCTACGCGLKAKIALAAQQCPKGRW